MSSKQSTPPGVKAPETSKVPEDWVEVTIIEPCYVNGEPRKVGFTDKVSPAEHTTLKNRGLIKTEVSGDV